MRKGHENRKNIRGISLAMTAIFIVSMLSGCSLGKPTAQSLLADYAKSMADMKTAEMTMNMKFDVEISQGDMALSMNVDSDSDIRYVKEEGDNFKAYSDMNMNVSLFGISQSAETESYVVSEDGEVTTYSRNLSEGQQDKWKRSSGTNFIMFGTDAVRLADVFTLNEDTVTEDGHECYVLSGEVTGADLPNMGENVGLDVDLKDIKMYETLKIDKDDKTPVSLTITADEDSFNKYITESMGDLLDGASAKIKDFEITLKVDSLNQEITIDIPDEVYEAEEASEEGILDIFGSSRDDSSKDDSLPDTDTSEDDSSSSSEDNEESSQVDSESSDASENE